MTDNPSNLGNYVTADTDSGWASLQSAAPKDVGWVRRLFFSDLGDDQAADLADLLSRFTRHSCAKGRCRGPTNGGNTTETNMRLYR